MYKRTFILMFLLQLNHFSWAQPGTDEGIGPMTRGYTLPQGHYWRVTNSHNGSAKDFVISRQLANGQLSGSTEDGGMNNYCQDGLEDCDIYGNSLTFGLPLYAPVEGVVASCWRNFLNAPVEGKPDPKRCCGGLTDSEGECTVRRSNGKAMACDSNSCPSALSTYNVENPGANAADVCPVTRSGNHITILTKDEHIVHYAHLAPGTIPEKLCPFKATDMVDSRNKPCDNCGAPVESILDRNARPTVNFGDFVGRIGRTGASSGPHVHTHIRKVQERADGSLESIDENPALLFNKQWMRPTQEPKVWKMMIGDPPPNSDNLIHSSPFMRIGDASAGAIRDIKTAFLAGNRAVTATIGQDNRKLKLITWDILTSGNFNRRAEMELGSVKDAALVRLDRQTILVAVRQDDDRLKMILFGITPDGRFARHDDISAGAIKALDMTEIPNAGKKAVVAVRDGDGNFKVIAFEADGTTLRRLGDASAGKVSALAIAPMTQNTGVFTAVRDGDGKLLVIPWVLSANGQQFNRRQSASAGSITETLDIAPIKQGVVVAVKDNNGKLRLITWAVQADGDMQQNRSATMVAGGVRDLSLITLPHSRGEFLATALRGDDDNLYLIGWSMNADGSNLQRAGSYNAGAISKLDASAISRQVNSQPARDAILTAMRTAAGDLKLIAWDTNLRYQ